MWVWMLPEPGNTEDGEGQGQRGVKEPLQPGSALSCQGCLFFFFFLLKKATEV